MVVSLGSGHTFSVTRKCVTEMPVWSRLRFSVHRDRGFHPGGVSGHPLSLARSCLGLPSCEAGRKDKEPSRRSPIPCTVLVFQRAGASAAFTGVSLPGLQTQTWQAPEPWLIRGNEPDQGAAWRNTSVTCLKKRTHVLLAGTCVAKPMVLWHNHPSVREGEPPSLHLRIRVGS